MTRRVIISLLFVISVNISTKSQILRTELVDNWQFKQENQTEWYPADVPGTVHTDLFANKLISEPFYGTNEKKLQWIENEHWIYKTTFDLSDEVFNKKNIHLVFY
ncbi:MAG: glycoside hydrolase family 2 protein, partial [Bacteroidota bacterium]|nr:glycoside hydrolase family 2 protein [Bacteroidota bacterium]